MKDPAMRNDYQIVLTATLCSLELRIGMCSAACTTNLGGYVQINTDTVRRIIHGANKNKTNTLFYKLLVGVFDTPVPTYTTWSSTLVVGDFQ
jgi:hypothetical protein